VVLARDRAGAGGIEVLMVRRQVKSDFAPDVYVFPGGSVQPGDRAAELAPGLCGAGAGATDGPTALGSGLRVAALRELFEEAGVLLAARADGPADAPLAMEPDGVARLASLRDELIAARMTFAALAAAEGLRLATDTLLHWAHWITPERFPKRFDTHFFLAAAPPGQVAAHDNLEVTESVWVEPEDALARYERGAFPLVFATVHQLRDLRGLAGVAAARARFAGREPETIMPLAFPAEDGGFLVKLPNDPGPPVHL
jgi:8-oxo-dGTP pyrophosphatase MutT (NUDIX family)